MPDSVNWADIHSIKRGDRASIRKRITPDDLDAFAEISGDRNPLHCDENTAAALGFSRRVAHGALSIAYISRLIGMSLPGPGALWRKLAIEFISPVWAGDEIEIALTVSRVSTGAGVVILEIAGTRLPDVEVLRGTAEVKILQKPAERVSVRSERDMGLDGQAAIVTGASRGIGRAIALALARSGARVVVNFRSDEKAADETVRLIHDSGGQAVAVRADITEASGPESIVSTAIREFGGVDVLVNNATPVVKGKLMLSVSYADICEYFDVYVKGALALIQQAVPEMRKKQRGRIIGVLTSFLAEVPPRMGPYIIGKSAAWGMSRALAVELAPYNITVNTVSPSMVLTDLTAMMGEQMREAAVRRTPLKRLATPEEVADTVLFLAGPQSGFVTGANIPVTGGILL